MLYELNQNEILEISGGCSCECYCRRGSDYWQVNLGKASSSLVCSGRCNDASSGGRLCGFLSCN